MTKHPKRPRDPIMLGFMIGNIATGQARDEEPAKNTARSKAGTIGGAKRAEKLTSQKKKEIAKGAAEVRWRGKSRDK